MSDPAIEEHCREIDRCNQRGGRMLSIVDLIEGGTVTPELAAYALAAIGRGASFMVGALPGGAGKTTVMGALLNFVPADVPLRAADGPRAIRAGLENSGQRTCYVCHEIGPGAYYAYLWGQALRDYFQLAKAGHILATNLHADTLSQARDQVCGDNGVPEAQLRKMNLVFFLAVSRGGFNARRRVVQVWESDGGREHQCVYEEGDGDVQISPSAWVAPDRLTAARRRIDTLLDSGARTIEQVRAEVVSTYHKRA